MAVTDSEIVILDRLLHPENALLPMEVMVLGIVMLYMFLLPKNAAFPMEVTELGMVVLLQPEIRVFVSVSMMALQLSRES